jgi:enamine deaminase RidA (YjgF/YER057c/UK114 family)
MQVGRAAKSAALIVGLGCLIVLSLSAAKKKPQKEETTQTLALPVDPPPVATGETRRLVFQNIPLTGKGLLSQQTRDGLKAALHMASGPVIHVRAFVAGSGDLRRVPQLVSEIFADKKVRLPSVSVVQVGALPLENAQIAIDIISVGKKEVNPDGLDFVATDTLVENTPGLPARPLLDKAVENLAGKIASRQAVSVTCFVSALQGAAEMTTALGAKFPGSATSVVQSQRAAYQTYAVCQAVVRGGSKAAELAFSGTRVAPGGADSQSALTLQRLDRDLTEAGMSAGNLLFTNVYSLLPQAGDTVRKLRTGAMAVVPVESVASVQAAFAVDSIAAVNK